MHIHYKAGNHIYRVINEGGRGMRGENTGVMREKTLHIDRPLTGVLSCWFGTPLLSDAANGFIMKNCSPG